MARDEGKLTLIIQELVRRSNEETRRLRDLEQRLLALETRYRNLETSTMLKTKKLSDRMIEIDAAMKMQNELITKLKVSIEKFSKQIDKFATKTDLKEVERMVELFNPVNQQFVTRKELEEFKRRTVVSV